MNSQEIKSTIREFIPKKEIWRSNMAGDYDFFKIKVKDNSVFLETAIGHSRYGKWKNFNIELKEGVSREVLLSTIAPVVDYYEECLGSKNAYANGFANYIEKTGGHKGNPVYMD